jgi:hypothetical protein
MQKKLEGLNTIPKQMLFVFFGITTNFQHNRYNVAG